ncbi:MAG: peptidase and in kexin sedolisin [Ilumatobacteraceae bacterium]|nr:peptidase and in kexin sedolisin [Ilumatobacteraceae bacterium]
MNTTQDGRGVIDAPMHRRRIAVGGRWRGVAMAVMAALPSIAVVDVATSSPTAASSDATDTGSLSAITQMTGAQKMWEQGIDGDGIGVALIDTGVAKVQGLAAPGKVIDGPDLSFDSQDPNLAHTDAFGHGTHLAGIIAGSDIAPGTSNKGCQTCLNNSAYSDTTKFEGMAPGAHIVNVKVGAYDGSVDVTQIIAGIDWVVQHRNDPGLNIRVLNLSFGTDSLQSADIDPLVFAVEQAWAAGIVVVAAAGNDGDKPGPLADPAMSPSVLAVGSIDPHGTLHTSDDTVADFAQHGTAARGVDIAAPGVSVLSLAVPGGFVDQNITTGKVGTRFQRASGTSQSTAVVSGLVALLLDKYPTATPDDIKTLLTMTGTGILGSGSGGKDKNYLGAGLADLTKLSSLLGLIVNGLLNAILPVPPHGKGTGTLEDSRGSYHVMIGDSALVGEVDIFGQPWVAKTMAAQTKARSTWSGSRWNGSTWSGDHFNGLVWSSAAWAGNDWTGQPWSGARWTDQVWNGARWSGARWSGARWSGARWTSAGWDGARWSGARWSGARWSDAVWG